MTSKTITRSVGQPSKDRIMLLQHNQCAYCDKAFGYENPPFFDHFIPYSYIPIAQEHNIFACCRACNAKKHNKVFNDLEDVRQFIMGRKRECMRCRKGFYSKSPTAKYCKPCKCKTINPNLSVDTYPKSDNGAQSESRRA